MGDGHLGRGVGLAVLLLATASGCCLCKSSSGGPGVIAAPAPAPAPALPSQWRAGAAVVQVTVPSGAPLAGYGGVPRRELTAATLPFNATALTGKCIDPTPGTPAALFKPSTGTADPITARALVLANDSRKIALVSLDTIGMSRQLRDQLADVANTLGIAPADLLVLATHTHSGPGGVSRQTLWEVSATDCFAKPVYDAVAAAATAALKQANGALQPARLGIGTTTMTGVSENRSGRPGVVDNTLGLIKITRLDGTPIAAVFNFAIHGTMLGPSNLELSADCMGKMESVIESTLPGAVAIFTNGAEGDVGPATGKTLDEVGTAVGDRVVWLWSTITTHDQGALSTALIDVAMPPPSLNPGGCLPLPGTGQTMCGTFSAFPLALPNDPDFVSTTLPFQAVAIDSTVLVAIPGEPITEIGWTIEQRAANAGFARAFVLALANDHGGYFTDDAQYHSGSYEANSTLYGPTTGEVVVDSAAEVIDQVQ